MNTIATRARVALNFKQYEQPNKPEQIHVLGLHPPIKRQYVLRMLIKEPFGHMRIPGELVWTAPMISLAYENQRKMGIEQPFCYVTVRHGEVTSKTDDEWHVDGFSMNITHLPEQNYVWSNKYCTEYAVIKANIPDDFDPSRHNMQKFLAGFVKSGDTGKCKPNNVYAMDPYILHRRGLIPQTTERTFIRVSFTPIEINDVNNTQNPLIPREYTRDGVKDFREGLVNYDA